MQNCTFLAFCLAVRFFLCTFAADYGLSAASQSCSWSVEFVRSAPCLRGLRAAKGRGPSAPFVGKRREASASSCELKSGKFRK